jgi:branched-subunit amino acid transport protein
VNIWLVMLEGGLLTYAIRASFIFWLGRGATPTWLKRSLKYVPPAILAALIAPDLLLLDGQMSLGWQNDRLLAGVLAILVAWRTRSALLAILAGMAVLVGLDLLR